MNNLIAGPGRSHQEWGNERAFAAIRSNGRVVTWGDAEYGGDSSAVANRLTRVTQIFSTGGAFAALRQDGTVVTWGNPNSGGNSSAVANQLTGVTQIFSTKYAFAALKQNGAVVTWGNSNSGGNSSDVAGQLTNVTEIFSTEEGFAALKGDRTVVAWGNAQYGGDTSNLANPLTDVTQIFSTRYAFAALKQNGSVVTWGNAQYGGNSLDVAGQITTGVTRIFSTEGAFAALKGNGSVVTWGDSQYGGVSTPVAGQITDVREIFATERAFAALKGNSSVVTWGDAQYGGNSSNVASQLTNVSKIFATGSAFAALKGDGSVVTWGDTQYGGDSSAVASQLTNVSKIFATDRAFAALKGDGSVVTWGDTQYGGDSSAVASQLTNVSKIFATDRAFAALKGDGSVVTWGDTQYGGDSSAVASQLRSAVEEIATPYSDDDVPTPFKPIIIDIGGVDSTVSGVTGDNRVVGIAVDPGIGNVIIRYGSTELGTAAVDENGNFTYSLTEDNINTIGQGTGKIITATQRDSVGNNISAASAPFTFGVDTIAPTVTITDNIPNFANIATGSILYTFTFSEPVTEFTTGDITVTNGSKGTFTPVSPTQYTLVVTPNANFEGDLTVAVAARAAIDSPGNPSLAPQASVQRVDTKAPTVTITSIGAGDRTVSGVAGDNTVVGTAEPGSGNVTIRFGNTQLGTTAVDGNGNFTYSLTTANITTIGPGTGKTITASQTDPAGNIGTSTPFTFGVDTIPPTDPGQPSTPGQPGPPGQPGTPGQPSTPGQPTVTVTDPNTRKSLSQPFDTVFKFSVEGSTRSSQVLEVVFGDGKTQSILTTLGNLSGLPLGSNSILANLQSALIRFSPNNVDVRSFQLRDMGTGIITTLNIKDVTERGFTLSGSGFTITAQILESTDSVKIFTNKVDVNGESLEAISLSNLIAPPNVDKITVKVDATLYREAAFDNLMGFYLAEKATGAVVNLDPLTGQIVDRVVPNNRQAYLSAVINNRVLIAEVANNEIQNISRSFLVNSRINLSDYVLLPFLVANGNLNSVAPDFSNLYVASIGTNSDGKDHVQLVGNNIFGFEDIAGSGDNDFDDVIFQVRGISLV